MIKKERQIWLDIIKILACYFVIINHSHVLFFKPAGISESTVSFDSVFFSVCKIAVPLFIMTTGALTLQENVSFKKTLSKIARISLPLLVLSVLFYLRAQGSQSSFLGFIKQFAENPVQISLWYLYMLPGLYLVIPFVGKIVQHSSMRELAVFLLFFLIVPTAIQCVSILFPYYFSAYWFITLFPVSICYLVAGFFLSKLPLKRSLFFLSICLFLVSVIPVAWLIVHTYKTTGKVEYAFDSWDVFPVIVASMAFFYMIRFLFAELSPEKRISKLLCGISATTFGIYAIHMLVMGTLFDLPVTQSLFAANPYLGIIVFQIAVFAFCSACIFLLRKIPIIRKFL